MVFVLPTFSSRVEAVVLKDPSIKTLRAIFARLPVVTAQLRKAYERLEKVRPMLKKLRGVNDSDVPGQLTRRITRFTVAPFKGYLPVLHESRPMLEGPCIESAEAHGIDPVKFWFCRFLKFKGSEKQILSFFEEKVKTVGGLRRFIRDLGGLLGDFSDTGLI